MPARRQRPRFRLAVADDTSNNQIGVVERRAVGMRDGIAKLATLVNRTGRLRRHVAWDAAGERELSEKALHALLVGRDVRINLAVGSLEISVGDQAGPAMPGAGNVEHVEVVFVDQPIQVNVNEIQSGRRSPMAEQPWFDVFLCKGLLEQWVVIKIDLTD